MTTEIPHADADHGQSLPAGTRIEEFVIERVLGTGGFGITYLAKDTALNRQVVIKENLPVQFCFRDTHSLTVAPRHSHGEDAENFQWSLENFSKEAAMLASLDHPGIVKVLRSFEAFGTAYFVMPFVDGVALDELAKKRLGKPFSEKELRGWLEHILPALGYLHERGIYHRDIKPGNILITSAGIPVLIDFGSARQRLSELSMTVVESAGYTPFEQLQSRGNIGPWSDLYALAATVAKAITGEALPKANDRVFDDPWLPLASRLGFLQAFSKGFLQSIDRALALQPRDRWQDGGAWLSTLRQFTTEPVQPSLVAPEVSADAQAPKVIQASWDSVRSASEMSDSQPGEEWEFDLIPGIKIQMCWMPPGDFLMGSPEDEMGRGEDETQHRVTLTRGFWMGKYSVTQAQWEAVVGNNPSSFNGEDLPVECVSWDDICGNDNRYGGFLEGINANTRKDVAFGLPTEAEWEYACRGRMTGSFSGDLGGMAWYCKNSSDRTHPVGLKQANSWSLKDMHGNVWEWCADNYLSYTKDKAVDPCGPSLGFMRVLRGGSWLSEFTGCRSAKRHRFSPAARARHLGFRLVLRHIP